MKKVYLMFTRTGTLFSRLIHSVLKGRYTHISIAIRPATDEFYSFARHSLRNPLNAGFMIENIHTLVFSKYPESDCAVFSLEISDESYEKIEDMINRFMSSSKRYRYNILGLLPLRFGIKLQRKHHFTCSQFVAAVLHESNSVKLPKDPSLMMPCDFLKLSGLVPVYKGKIKNCTITPTTETVDLI